MATLFTIIILSPLVIAVYILLFMLIFGIIKDIKCEKND